MRERRLVFGEVANSYDRQRPSYPPEIVDGILSFACLQDESTTAVAEVGAGTGKASVLFAQRGISLSCLEPSPSMAALARENLAPFPNAAVLETSYEDWQPVAHSYGLVFAAQSWHWVSPELRYQKAHLALKGRGSLALLWNVVLSRGDESLEDALAAAYGDLIETKPERNRSERIAAHNWLMDEIEASGLFEPGPLTVLCQPWRHTYEAEAFVELLSTHSDHRMLEEGTRAQLFDRIRTALDAGGGHVEVGYVTVCYLARTLGGNLP
ncbi:MAG: class I SAM-dependent methyltransferase [Acidimicrobiales bacterium]